MDLRMEERPFKVAIEGNIGAGKSTLIKYFSKIPGIETHGEPIEHWRNCNGHNLLDLMYSDIKQWLCVFQNYVQLTRLKVQTRLPKSSETKVQMFERSVQNNRFCFLELAYKSGFLTDVDYIVLNEWYKWIENNNDIHLDLIVYLRSTPEVVYERIKQRGRPEEKEISLDYLRKLHESHEDWLIKGDFNDIPVLVMDADKTVQEVEDELKRHQDRILGVRMTA